MTLYNVGKIRECSDVWLRPVRLLAALLVVAPAVLLCLIRTTLFTFLLIFQPLVSFVLSATAVLGALTAVALAASSTAETFPFWGMIGFSFACAMLLAVYHAVMRVLSP